MPTPIAPSLSVIIPVRNGGAAFAVCLEALSRSKYRDFELVVVDDGSSDGSDEAARRHDATVLTTGGAEGPAAARNLGAAVASAETLLFLDADCEVHEDTLDWVVEALTDDQLVAVFGSYDDEPKAKGIVSRFRNLLHHFVHQTSRPEIETFWAGCGAVRKQAFLAVGGFDAERYQRPSIEDIDLGYRLTDAGGRIAVRPDALLTLPVSKASIAEHAQPGFVGHTDYLAEDAGLEIYGTDYLMCFLAGELQVALLSTHVPLREAIGSVKRETILAALCCLHRHAGGRIAVAGLNPHAGEGGLLGDDEELEILPAVKDARIRGIDVHGPFSADSLFSRCRRGEFDWVLALYHDQGLVAVKTATFGTATNWTLGLPYLRTSVDHGTAFDIAGRGAADAEPLRRALESTLALLSGDLPRREASAR